MVVPALKRLGSNGSHRARQENYFKSSHSIHAAFRFNWFFFFGFSDSILYAIGRLSFGLYIQLSLLIMLLFALASSKVNDAQNCGLAARKLSSLGLVASWFVTFIHASNIIYRTGGAHAQLILNTPRTPSVIVERSLREGLSAS